MPVWAVAPKSIIVSPAPGETVGVAAAREIHGWAWADGGVRAVDVTADDGVTWLPADIEPVNTHQWQRFSLRWKPSGRGNVTLASCAHVQTRACGSRHQAVATPFIAFLLQLANEHRILARLCARFRCSQMSELPEITTVQPGSMHVHVLPAFQGRRLSHRLRVSRRGKVGRQGLRLDR